MLLLARARRNVVVRYSAAFGILRYLLVFFRVGYYDVPSVDQARKEAETAERDVDEGIAGANASLDPDCEVSVMPGGECLQQ